MEKTKNEIKDKHVKATGGFKKLAALIAVGVATLSSAFILTGCDDTLGTATTALNSDTDYLILNDVLHFGRGYNTYASSKYNSYNSLWMNLDCCQNKVYNPENIFDKKPDSSMYTSEHTV